MEANGLRFWMLADRCDWQFESRAAYDHARRSVHLQSVSQRELTAAPVAFAEANSQREIVPRARDAYGTFAYWDAIRHQIMASGALSGAVPIFAPLSGEWPTDLAMGYDGVLYIALTSGAIILLDRRDRWDPQRMQVPGFSAWRLAPDPSGGVWVLDKSRRLLARLEGLPLPRRPYSLPAPDAARPCQENPNPPRLDISPDTVCPIAEEPSGLACSPQGQLAVLTWFEPSGETRLRLLMPTGRLSDPITLRGAQRAYSLAWVSVDQVAVLVGQLVEAPVYLVLDAALPPDPRCEAAAPPSAGQRQVDPVGDLYPLPGYQGGPFLHGLDLPPHFPLPSPAPGEPASSSPLYHLSLPSFAYDGEARNNPSFPLDSGSSATVWHRLYVEANLPPGCGLQVYLAATDDVADTIAEIDWHLHTFGAVAPEPGTAQFFSPRAAWVRFPSEVPHSPGLLQCEPQKDRSGLFTVLIQRSNRPVSALRGRYLHVRVRLLGDGRSSPEVAAIRAYASRFSYRDRYLPQLYGELVTGPDADLPLLPGPSARRTPADFLERFLDNFEGILTPLEGRVAEAYLVTDPTQAPAESLDWLGGWVGMAFDPWYPEERRRTALQNAPELHRWHGTLRGLKLALNLATGGGVKSGAIVVLENFRLRRTFATILGADLSDELDPLLQGLSASGNSFVGDTLFLGDEQRQEFLALFGADLRLASGEEQSVAALFDNLAYRVTVFVHQELEPQDLALIRRVVDLEAPAHVEAKVLTASHGFLIAVASLVGIDTYLGVKPRPGTVRVDGSQLGVRDLLQHSPSLDPRLESGNYGLPPGEMRPIADPGPARSVPLGEDFELDGSRSRAFAGHIVTRFIWDLLD